MPKHKTGTHKEWLAARLDLLKAEKEFTRRSDELARQRQELPWVRIDKPYRFDTDEGSASLADFASYWPKAESSPIADGLNAATKYVTTHRPDSLGWGPVKDLGKDIVEGIRGIKSKDGPDLIVWGSSTLTSVLLEKGLVDEVLLLVCPVLLGRGKRFFSDSANPRELALVSTKAAPSGVLMNTYRHLGSLRSNKP